MHDHVVRTLDLAGNSEVIVEIPGQPSGLGFLPDGSLLIVSMIDQRLLRFANKQISEVAKLDTLASFHLNDMLVDSFGNAFIGNFGFDLNAGAPAQDAELIRVTPEGKCSVVAEQLRFPNGMALTPDGKNLIVAETFGRRLTVFDVDKNQNLSNRQLWADLGNIVPDGICLDENNEVWVAAPTSNAIFRIRRGGEIAQVIELEHQSYACMLGGEKRLTLFILTAETSDPAESRKKRSARIETIEVTTPGAGLP
jgi:sugar lactone lactonase YvrE